MPPATACTIRIRLHTQFYVVGPLRRGETTAAEHAEDHHAVDTRQRRTFQMNQLVVAPIVPA